MELQEGLIRVELQVELKECHYYSNHALLVCVVQIGILNYRCCDSQEHSPCSSLYDMASQDGFNPDIHFIKRL